MINPIIFVLSENDKRIIIAFAMFLFLGFVFLAYLGYWITRIIKYQGKKMDNYTYDVVISRVITNKKAFKKYARKKNNYVFFKQAMIPMLIMFFSAVFLLIVEAFRAFQYNPFSQENGFPSILWIWDFKNKVPHDFKFLGLEMTIKLPNLIHSPTFVIEAIPSYISIIGFIIGFIWYLITIQGYIARMIRIEKKSDDIFAKSLDGYNQNEQFAKALSNQILYHSLKDDNK